MRSVALFCALASVFAVACGGDTEPLGGGRDLDRALLEAAAGGDARSVRDLLARGAQVEARDGKGRTALAAAAFGNHLAAARELVRAGADVNAKDATQQSAYLIASSEVGDDARLLALTLDHGAEVDDKDSFNGTALIRAAERGHPRIVAALLRAGIDRDHVNRLGWTALHEAIVLGDGGPAHVATVRALIAGGVDVNARGTTGRPLVHAEQRGHEAIARMLRAAGARR